MTGSPPLPPGCLLRPAKPTDKAQIRKFLVRLQQETTPAESRNWWTIVVVVIGLLVASWFIFGRELFLQLVAGWMFLLFVVWLNTFNQGEWLDFWVIEYENSLVACAKLCQYSDYSVLFDLFVIPEWRNQGLGSFLVGHLGQVAKKPLYLACVPATVSFYIRLGFHRVSAKNLSAWLQYKLGIQGRSRIVPMVLQ